MDDNKYTQLLRLQSAEVTGRTAFCPEDQEIAEYYDSDLAEAARRKLEHHITGCRFCLGRIGALSRQEHNFSTRRVPEAVLAAAKQIEHPIPARQPTRAPAWAAAAVVIIGLFAIVGRNSDLIPASPSASTTLPSNELNSRQLRSVSQDAARLNVLVPAPGADIKPNSLLRWAEVPGNIHYNIFVLSESGDVLWTERLAGTHWVLNESLQLAANSKYYFRVEAQMPDGRSVSSRHVVFEFKEQQ